MNDSLIFVQYRTSFDLLYFLYPQRIHIGLIHNTNYLIYFEQEGSCGYTIGCGYVTYEYQAESDDDVRQHIFKLLQTDYSSLESKVDFVCFYEVSERKEIEVDKLYRQIEDNRQRLNDRAELERLEKRIKLLKEKM